jgi:hypothetical protein
MENIKALIRLKHPELKDVKIIEEGYFDNGYIEFVFENGRRISTGTNSLIDEILGLILKEN